jgi:nifR3 family TIM-barrel protein
MDGVADSAFRELCYRMGAELTISEFAPAAGIIANPKRLLPLIGARHGDRPFLIQLYGTAPAEFAAAARIVADALPCSGIDVNMGCPADKVVAHNHGSALMKDPNLGADIVAAMVATQPLPVSVKLRAGWETVNAPEVAAIVEVAGASLVTIHGRTRMQRFTGTADLDAIAATVQAVRIPVIGNGDVVDAVSARRMVEKTHVAGVMVGRGAEGNPWIFGELLLALRGEQPPFEARWDRPRVVREHAQCVYELHGTSRFALLPMRKHLVWYARGVSGKATLREQAQQIETPDDIERWVRALEDALHEQRQMDATDAA